MRAAIAVDRRGVAARRNDDHRIAATELVGIGVAHVAGEAEPAGPSIRIDIWSWLVSAST
jgi:hypothetical protein